MSIALTDTGPSAPGNDPALPDWAPAPAQDRRLTLFPLVAAICGIAVVAAIKLLHLWMASMPIVDLRL